MCVHVTVGLVCTYVHTYFCLSQPVCFCLSLSSVGPSVPGCPGHPQAVCPGVDAASVGCHCDTAHCRQHCHGEKGGEGRCVCKWEWRWRCLSAQLHSVCMSVCTCAVWKDIFFLCVMLTLLLHLMFVCYTVYVCVGCVHVCACVCHPATSPLPSGTPLLFCTS